MITEEFAQLLLTTFNDPSQNPVHLLFNQWWQHAPEDVKASYIDQMMSDPDFVAWVEARHYAEPLVLSELAGLPPGSLGRTYHDWIVDNNLTAQIAINYQKFHDTLVAAGQLDGMPESMRYAIIRGFQTHDFQHVITGYDSSGRGEIALQAFCLAQIQFPYFGMWLSVVSTRMTFVDPKMITPTMDAVSEGWQHGRRTPSVQFVEWEKHLEENLDDVRARLGVEPQKLLIAAAT